MMNHFVWIDLGVSNLDRAIEFYEKVLAREVIKQSFDGYDFAVFSHSGNEVSGCLVPKSDFVPVPASTLIYMNVDGRLNDATAQVEQYGGKVIQPPHSIGPHGSRALICDSEGNYMALHSSTCAL